MVYKGICRVTTGDYFKECKNLINYRTTFLKNKQTTTATEIYIYFDD